MLEACASDAASRSLRVDAARVGDRIRTPAGCEPITGFLHAEADVRAAYHVIRTKSGRELSIARNHWLWINGADADPSTVKRGDRVQTSDGAEDVVTDVRVEYKEGAWHPMVASGSYYANGVRASTYVSYVPPLVWRILGDGYAALRYKLGVPIRAEGQGWMRVSWVYDAGVRAGLSRAAMETYWWPLSTAGALGAEAVNSGVLMALGAAALAYRRRRKA